MAKAGGGRANNVFTPTEGNGARPTSAKENPQLDYLFRTRSQVTRARRREERLMQCYRDWLSKKHRALQIMVYAGRFRCDGYDVVRRNLIEAKSSANREYIRMAVGQLLDYSYLSKEAGYKPPHLAILLPERPLKQIETWLASHAIGIIFPAKGAFVDNARGQFV